MHPSGGRALDDLVSGIHHLGYGRPLRLERGAAIAISQSGKSPDIVALTEAARAGGAVTFALTNTMGSPLSQAAEHAVDLRCGVEQSVAATKSFVASVVAGLALLAHWQQDAGLLAMLESLPAVTSQTSNLAARPKPLHRLAEVLSLSDGPLRVTYREADDLVPVVGELIGA